MRCAAGIALAALLLAGSLPAAGADLRRLESVGVVPIDDLTRRTTHRDRAVSAAVARAVERVATQALPEGPDDGHPLDDRVGTLEPLGRLRRRLAPSEAGEAVRVEDLEA